MIGRPPSPPLFPAPPLFRSHESPVILSPHPADLRKIRRPLEHIVDGLVKKRRLNMMHQGDKQQSGFIRAERSEEHTSELQSPDHLVCRLLLEKKNRPSTHRR